MLFFLKLFSAIWGGVLALLAIVFGILGAAGQSGGLVVAAICGALAIPALAIAGYVSRRIRRLRERREQGETTVAEIVRVRLKPYTRIGQLLTYELTVRFNAGTTPVEQRKTVSVAPTMPLDSARQLEIRFDPRDPSNFEPLRVLR